MTSIKHDALGEIFDRLDKLEPPALQRPKCGSVSATNIELFLAAVARGYSLRSAAATAGVGLTTVYNRRLRDRNFARRLEAARTAGVTALTAARLADLA